MDIRFFVKSIKFKKSTILLTLYTDAEVTPRKITFAHNNITSPCAYPFEFSVSHQKGTEIHAQITIGELELQAGDWSIIIDLGTETDPELHFPILDKKLRVLLILLNYTYRFANNYILFPLGSTGHKCIFRCRLANKYDGICTYLKIFLIYGLSKLLNPVLKRKNIWIVYEKFCCTAQENGYYFFKYCMEQLPPSKSKNIYFILDKNSAPWDSMKKYGKHILPFMSFRHLLYLLCAQLYIGSDAKTHLFQWMPKPNLISREINRHDIFFLQHGVLALKRVEHLFGKNGMMPMTYFTTSSRFEQDIVVKYMDYTPDEAPILGLARWDALENKSVSDTPKILIMPTWRSWLDGQNDEFFCSSEYYNTYMSLLQNPVLLNLLKNSRTKLTFYIHPKLRDFIKNFHTQNPQIELISFGEQPLNKLIMECSMLITDYSSVCWDAYYLEKPILFYQFDMEYYEQTNGSYIDMERELFGDRCTREEELVQLIQNYVQNGFQEKKCYADMRKDLFVYRDHNNCQRTYEFISNKYGR